MARFTANGGLRLLLLGERYCFGGEPTEPGKFRVCGEKNLKNLVSIRSKGRGGWQQVLAGVSAAGKVEGNSKEGEKLKKESFDDIDVEGDKNDEDEDEFGVDELTCYRGLVLDIFYRYCSSRQDCTVDHVLPISRGGEWKWENLVTACTRCNSRKGHKSLEEANMKLIKIPKAPKDYDVLSVPMTSAAVRMLRLRKGVPDEWRQYLPSS